MTIRDGEGFIIEHPTRGVLVDLDWNGTEWSHQFAWSKPRTKAKRFSTFPDTTTALSRIPLSIGLACAVRRWKTWEIVA